MSPIKFLLLIFSFPFLRCQAQVDTLSINGYHNFIISISGGMAAPFGKFSFFEIDSSSYTTNISGIPKTGINGKADFMYFFSKKFGVTASFFSSSNESSDVDSASLFYDPCPQCAALGGGKVRTSYSYKANNWNTKSFMAGMVFRIIDKNRIMNFRINGGVQQVHSPETQLNETGYWWTSNPDSGPYSSSYIEPQMTSYNFVFDAGIDLQFFIKNKLGFIISTDFMTSKATFSGKAIYSYDALNGANHYYSQEQHALNFVKNINLFNLNAGILYALR